MPLEKIYFFGTSNQEHEIFDGFEFRRFELCEEFFSYGKRWLEAAEIVNLRIKENESAFVMEHGAFVLSNVQHSFELIFKGILSGLGKHVPYDHDLARLVNDMRDDAPPDLLEVAEFLASQFNIIDDRPESAEKNEVKKAKKKNSLTPYILQKYPPGEEWKCSMDARVFDANQMQALIDIAFRFFEDAGNFISQARLNK